MSVVLVVGFGKPVRVSIPELVDSEVFWSTILTVLLESLYINVKACLCAIAYCRVSLRRVMISFGIADDLVRRREEIICGIAIAEITPMITTTITISTIDLPASDDRSP